MCVIRGESETEGVWRLNGGQPHPPLPLNSDWEKPGGDGVSLPFFLGLPLRPSPLISVPMRGYGELGESRDAGPEGAGAGAGVWLSQGRALGCVGRGVCKRVKRGGRFPSSSSSWEEERG